MVDEKTVDINYLKSSGFREVACDGILGGPTPSGKVWIAFYTERYPLPRLTRHNVTPSSDGFVLDMPGEPVDSREGIIRNVEFGVYMSREEAKSLSKWLLDVLAKMKEDDGEQTS